MTKRKNDDTLQRIAELKAQRARELQSIIDRMTGELAQLEAQLAATDDQSEQTLIETEIVHFTMALNQLRRGAGPPPMHGGAATALDSET
jgi:TolA-binding protein